MSHRLRDKEFAISLIYYLPHILAFRHFVKFIHLKLQSLDLPLQESKEYCGILATC